MVCWILLFEPPNKLSNKPIQKSIMTQNYPPLWARILVGFIGNFALLAITAAVFGDPLVQPRFFPELASDNPNIVLILGGALLNSILLALIYPSFNIDVSHGWFGNTARIAIPLGLAVYFATHMVQAGYINVSATGWLLEGLYDSTAPMAAIFAMAFLTYRRSRA